MATITLKECVRVCKECGRKDGAEWVPLYDGETRIESDADSEPLVALANILVTVGLVDCALPDDLRIYLDNRCEKLI